MRNFACAFALVVAGCGGGDGNPATDGPPSSDGPGGGDAPTDTPPTAFALTSPAYSEGGTIPVDQTCNGANTSPQLDWVGGPAGTMSFAVVLTDKSNNLIHAVIYDIPSTNTGLPADVDKVFAPADVPGAHQTTSYDPSVRGYNGPCPPSTHTYEMKLFALDVAALPGATMQTTRAQAVVLIDQHDLAAATLTATYTP